MPGTIAQGDREERLKKRREQRLERCARRAAAPALPPIFLRRSDAAAALAVSEGQILIWERAGRLTPVRLPDCRAVRLARADVEELAEQIRRGAIA